MKRLTIIIIGLVLVLLSINFCDELTKFSVIILYCLIVFLIFIFSVYYSDKKAREDPTSKQKNRYDLEEEYKKSGILYCPVCLSIHLEGENEISRSKAIIGDALAGPAGFLVGGMDCKKIKVKCLNCGHSWHIKI